VGRFTPQKNPLDFVRVAARVREQVPGAQFLFIGDGALRQETENLRAELHLTRDMFFPGMRPDVPQMLRCMDVFMLTSLWEGLPRVIPQAMAAGLPVVANGVDGVCEVIDEGKNGFIIPPHNVELMADKIVLLLSDRALCKQLGAAGKKTAQQEFSVVEMVKKIEALYEELLGKKNVPI
jgi:glycosyltransferase involved in cell wall biosynthesis